LLRDGCHALLVERPIRVRQHPRADLHDNCLGTSSDFQSERIGHTDSALLLEILRLWPIDAVSLAAEAGPAEQGLNSE
jgi:hypothetical protein